MLPSVSACTRSEISKLDLIFNSLGIANLNNNAYFFVNNEDFFAKTGYGDLYLLAACNRQANSVIEFSRIIVALATKKISCLLLT
jgi:hypothetical protein